MWSGVHSARDKGGGSVSKHVRRLGCGVKRPTKSQEGVNATWLESVDSLRILFLMLLAPHTCLRPTSSFSANMLARVEKVTWLGDTSRDFTSLCAVY